MCYCYTCVSYILRVCLLCFYLLLLHQNPPWTWGIVCVVLGVRVISVFDAVAFLACAHRVSSTVMGDLYLSITHVFYSCTHIWVWWTSLINRCNVFNSNFKTPWDWISLNYHHISFFTLSCQGRMGSNKWWRKQRGLLVSVSIFTLLSKCHQPWCLCTYTVSVFMAWPEAPWVQRYNLGA